MNLNLFETLNLSFRSRVVARGDSSGIFELKLL